MNVLMMRLVWLAAFFIRVQAQTGPQATQLPACIKACDPAAIASVNCTNADQYCHCVKQGGILYNITACADSTCTNPSASLYTFTTLFGEVCAPFNISVPVLGSNATANGTIVVLPSLTPSSVAYKGGAASGGFGNDNTSLGFFIAACSLLAMVMGIF